MKAHFTTRLLTIAAAILLCASVFAANAQRAASVHPPTDTRTAAPLPALPTTSTEKTVAAAEEMESSAEPKGEGIKVHGHWVLELKNPDGKLVERREFNNSLVTGGGALSGDQALAAVIAGVASPGGLAVAFISGPVSTPGIDATSFCNANVFIPNAPAGITCFTLSPGGNSLFPASPSLPNEPFATYAETGLSTVVSFSPVVSIQLSGNYTVLPAYPLSSISAVQTYLYLCLPLHVSALTVPRFTGTAAALLGPTSPSSCNDAAPGSIITNETFSYAALTSTIIPGGPLAVTPNQIITVTVTLSFS